MFIRTEMTMWSWSYTLYLIPATTSHSHLILAQSYLLPSLQLLGITKQMESNSQIFAKEGDREKERESALKSTQHIFALCSKLEAIFGHFSYANICLPKIS